jgi:hypothetical protein
MTEKIKLRTDLPPLPKNISRLRVDPDRGYPVPWFVKWIEGKPEFRLADRQKLFVAVRTYRCWICGRAMKRNRPVAFVGGPIMAINRTSSEPPSHRDCAIFAAQACPFLAKPNMIRRVDGLPPETEAQPGTLIKRNAGIVLIWMTTDHKVLKFEDGFLFHTGAPTEILAYREARIADQAELRDALDEALPLMEQAVIAGGGDVSQLNNLVAAKRAAMITLGLLKEGKNGDIKTDGDTDAG